KNVSGPGVLIDDPQTELFQFLNDLLPGERFSKAKVPMVTAVLSVVDFSLATGQALLAGCTLDQTRRARQLLERPLLEVIPDHEWFKTDEENRFERFCAWLSRLKSFRPPGRLAMITTNYDMTSD